MKLIHITDPHFTVSGKKLYDFNPRNRLDACVADINTHHSDADLCVITGDLTHWKEFDAYRDLRNCLAELKIPTQLVIGNHDDRKTLLEAFPKTSVDINGCIQSSLETSVGRFLFLDTVASGTHQGSYCEQRRHWLQQQLDSAGDQAVYLFMHHPPFKIGIKSLDALCIEECEALADLVSPFRNIKHLFFGHVHRPISGSWCGIPFTTLRTTNHQHWVDFNDSAESTMDSHEPSAYAIALLEEKQLHKQVIQFHDYLDKGPKFDLKKFDTPSTAWGGSVKTSSMTA